MKSEDKLVVIWSSADKDVAIRMVFMYVYNAKKYGWWDDITLLVWGPSAQLLTQDIDLQEYLKKIKEIGIELKACKACADITGASDNLISQGVDVKYMGVELTNYIKEGRHILTF
ncbi:MAG: DsrE family protein [Ignavibacteria bacterium RBG_13_36_8]|nr:MAG: DsrE family protein [Ignavibacteria bacterium RBG_13_36_8]